MPDQATAQNYKVFDEDLNAVNEGYTVMQVWGTDYEMGYAQGFYSAQEIVGGVEDLKALIGLTMYSVVKAAIAATVWKPAAMDVELQGMLAGIKAVLPAVGLDVNDIKVLNTYGDWAYACRSHSTWGSFVQGSTKTLSTRRLDFGAPVDLAHHHVLIARIPADGSTKWINLALPGYVVVATGVNEYGTLASLHDYQSQAVVGAFMPRTVATRWALTMIQGLPLDQHLDTVFNALSSQPITTGTFINSYVPEGLGGVIPCTGGQACHKKRVPQSDFFGGEVLLTTNAETDGHSAPYDDSFMEDYYLAGGTKSISDHYGLMGHTGLHLLTVDYRGFGDMTLWAEGRTSSGHTPTMKVEFAQMMSGIFPSTDGGPPPMLDAGQPPGKDGAPNPQADHGTQPATDRGSQPAVDRGVPITNDAAHHGARDGAAASDTSVIAEPDEGCSCRVADEPSISVISIVVFLGLALVRRRRRQ